MLHRSNSEMFVETQILNENRNLANLPESKTLLPEFIHILPADAKSVLYEREYYDQYLAITLGTLKNILNDASVSFIRNPLLIYCDMDYLGGFLYVIDIQFNSHWNDTIHTTVTERGVQVPAWIISLRQQLVYTEVMRITPDDNERYRIFIDFRRITPPHWVKVKKTNHLLDNVIDVKAIIQEQYQELSKTLTREDEQIKTNSPVLQVKANLPGLSAPPPILPDQSSNKKKVQANLVDLFGQLKKKTPVPPPAPVVDAMDIDEEPISLPKEPSYTEKAMTELNSNSEAEPYLNEQFRQFYAVQPLPEIYKKEPLYKDYIIYLNKAIATIDEYKATTPNLVVFHTIMVYSQTNPTPSDEIVFDDLSALESTMEKLTCALTNKTIPTLQTCAMVLPKTGQRILVHREKIGLLKNVIISGHLLDKIMMEKHDYLTESKGRPNQTVLFKMADQWQKMFIMVLRILGKLLVQACKK